MSANSNNQGRAYEYAWINTLFQTLNSIRETGIVCNSSYDANERAWNADQRSCMPQLRPSAAK